MNSLTTILALFLILAVLFFLPTTNYQLPTVSAQNSPPCPVQSSYPRVTGGLISTPDISGSIRDSINKFSNPTGTCVVNSLASFSSYKIATYADLKSIYFTQSKATKIVNTNPNPPAIAAVANNTLYNYTNTGVSTGALSYGASTAVIFMDNSLSINNNITGTTGGLVIVVAGDVNIATTVTRIDAVIISSGIIRTAGATCSHSPSTEAIQLTINGSLISIYKDRPQERTCASTPSPSCPIIEFCRKLAGNGNNTTAAEVINQQPKYLVILRNIFSDTLQEWSEIP